MPHDPFAGRRRLPRPWSALLLVGAVLAPWCPSPAWAGAPTTQVKAAVEGVIHALDGSASTPARRAAIRREAEGLFDFQEMARRSLGRHWQGLGEADRGEFVSLFADVLERAYVSKVEQYSGERIVFAGEAPDGDVVTVKTRFITKQGTEIPIDYRMFRRGDRWLAYDVIIEGVSLIANYRAQFDKIIRTTSYADLVARLKKSQAGLGTPVPAKQSPRS